MQVGRNGFISPSTDAAVERAATEVAEAALSFRAAMSLPRNVAGNLSISDDSLIRRDRGGQPASRRQCSTAPAGLVILGFLTLGTIHD